LARPGADFWLAGISDPPAAWRVVGARGVNADEVRSRFGSEFSLVDEKVTGPIGRAGQFALYHLVRRQAGLAGWVGRLTGSAISAGPRHWLRDSYIIK